MANKKCKGCGKAFKFPKGFTTNIKCKKCNRNLLWHKDSKGPEYYEAEKE